jgi:hypothetical protein
LKEKINGILYWERHPNGPFVTLITVTTTYLEPEIYDLAP